MGYRSTGAALLYRTETGGGSMGAGREIEGGPLEVRRAHATDARRPRGSHATDARSQCGGRAENARRTSRGIGRRAAQRRKRHVRGACRSRAPDRGTRVHGSTVRFARKDSAGVRRFPPPARRATRIRGRSAISIGIRGRLSGGRAASAHQRGGAGRVEAPSKGAPPAGENRPLALYS